MPPRLSLSRFVLAVLLAPALSTSLVPIANLSSTAIAQAQMREDKKVEGDRLLQREKLITQNIQILGDKTEANRLFKLGEKQFREDKYQDALITFQTVLVV